MISFFNNYSGNIPSIKRSQIKNWLRLMVLSAGIHRMRLHIHYIHDTQMHSINTAYLNHDYYTDIITFDYSTPKICKGELFISPDTVQSNATKYRVKYEEEFLRVHAHGLLHLLGYKDKSSEEKAQMRKAEEHALQLFYTTFAI